MSSGGRAGGVDCRVKKGRKEGQMRKEKARGYEEMRKGQGLGLSKQSGKTETSGQKRCEFSVFHPTQQSTKYCKLRRLREGTACAGVQTPLEGEGEAEEAEEGEGRRK
eukprot:Nk52_evm3s230 gene=Nk52_evmTU3s230